MRLEISEEIHKENFKKFDLFRKLGNKNFLAWVSARLKSQLFTSSSYYYQKGDLVDNFYFVIRGMGAFVIAEADNQMCSIVDPSLFIERRNNSKRAGVAVLQYFGCEDMVINVAAQVHDNNRSSDDFSFAKNGFKVANRRYFSVQAI